MNSRDELLAIDMSDVYTPQYTAELDRIRREAELVLSRIAVRHIFDTGAVSHDPGQPPPAEPTRRQPFLFRKRLIEYLADRGELLRDGDRYRPAPELLDRAAASDAAYLGTAAEGSSTLTAMRAIERIAPGVLRGEDGLSLLERELGAEQTWRTWQYLMVDAAAKRACNLFVARVLDQRLRAGEPTVVFEGGAGLGATLRHALGIPGFRQRAAAIKQYGFTDINRQLMRQAAEQLRSQAAELLAVTSFDRVDLDQLGSYDDVPYLQTGAADLIIFESVLHDVEDLNQVLTACHRILKPGGWLAFTVGSRTRPGNFFPWELLQSTLHSYYRAKLDPPRRINVGYLTHEEWSRSLADAGFPEFRAFPDPTDRERWPYGGIVAERPADAREPVEPTS